MTYSRLYADSEMRVMQACGLSMQRLVEMTGYFALIVTLIILILMLWVNPIIVVQKDKLLTQGGAANILDALMPGRFQILNGGRQVVYVEKITRDHKQADNLFMADQGKTKPTDKTKSWTVLSAAEGSQMTNHKTHERFVIATDGYRYEGVPGQNNYQIIQFKKYVTRLPNIAANTNRQEQAALSTQKLFKTYHNPNAAAELQWRISIPLSAFILALLAVPLSQVKPRHGRYSMLLPAILIYVVYMNLLFVARNFVEQKMVPLGIGIWWVHLLVIVIFLIYFFARRNWRLKVFS